MYEYCYFPNSSILCSSFKEQKKQLSVLLGYDIAIQALNYHHSYISKQLRLPAPGGPSPHNLA